ncbi:head-tail connector [Citromicrobium phage vB_CbaS-RXM]|nr:head-tail connector [Citromicrobium phage vB_CbaS-RXM]
MVTLVVEDGTGLPTANAFASVEEVDAILEPNIHSLWSGIDTEDKKKLIVWATMILIQRARWKGCRVSATSGTPFPRSGLRDQDRNFYPDDAIPQPLKVATALLADHLSQQDPTLANGQKNLKRLDVDVISLQFDMETTPERWPTSIGIILRDIAKLSFSGTGGKPIIKH